MEAIALVKKWEPLKAVPGEQFCEFCGEALLYSWRHDAYFCPECDIWTDEPCDDPRCKYCADRPERPSEALEE